MDGNSDSRATVLIVDDEPENLEMLSALLRPHYQVVAVQSGEEALRAAALEPRPDLVLLDIVMPGMDGYEVLERLQSLPASAHIPVVFVTGRNASEDEQRGLELGAVDYITKPLLAPVVLARVANQLELAEARNRLAQQVTDRTDELEKTQAQLLQAAKMASIGVLAAGVAHEINNPVGFVSSNLQTLAGDLDDLIALLDAYAKIESALPADAAEGAELRAAKERADYDFLRQDLTELVAESQEGIERVKQIVQDLRRFAHTDAEEQWDVADIHQELDSTLNIVWNELRYKAEVVKEYADLPRIECLPSQLNQVFMNLLVNAADAIDEKGTITLRTGVAGDSVWLEVEDNGGGIAPEDLSRVFDTLFTTKPVGKGTGLGLSLARKIVDRHGGSIDVRSDLGVGTVFRVTLPVRRTQEGSC